MLNLPGKKILFAVWQFYGLTNRQLSRLLFPGSLHYAQEQTKRLEDEGYIRHILADRKTERGSVPRLFFLTDKGRAFVRGEGLDPTGLPQQPPDSQSSRLSHLEAVNDLLISAYLLPIERLGFWHEWQLRVLRLSVTPDGWAGYQVGSQKAGICFELDRGTEWAKFFKEKIAKLLVFSGGEYRQLGLPSLTIAIMTPRAERARQVLTWIEEVLTEQSKEHWAPLFRVTPVSPLQVEPQQLFCEPWWVKPFSTDYLPLLEGGG